MHTFITAVGLAAGASAAILPRNDGCCFQLSASGGVSGTVGQLDDGQNRVGGNLGSATYCINAGSITDDSGNGCILTSPTTQFQCDKGASPDDGFSVNSDGMLEHSGDSTFYACPADQGEYNLYTEKVDGQPKCVEVSLSTGGKCYGGASQSSAAGGYSQSSPAAQACPPQQTVTKTEQVKPSTVTKTETETETKRNTQYMTKTEQNTQYKPTTTTVYKTETQQNTKVVPTTLCSTSIKTVEETETATKAITEFDTKTIQTTVTAQTPTTIYRTSTIEETSTVPTTITATSTEQATVTAKPKTVYSTSTVEEVETKKVPVTETQYKTATEYKTTTEQGKPVTKYVTKVQTKTEENCPQTQPTQGGEQPTQGGAKPTQTNKGSACPTDLSGPYQSPHLIVPVSSESPDKSYGTSYNGMMSSSMSSVFNFDIPKSYEGQSCSLVFLFPKKSDLETSDYTFNGQGSISVDHLGTAAGEHTTWNSVPSVDSHMGSFSPQPGNSYVVSTGSCPAGTTQSYELSASSGLDLEYFQDYNPSPIGLYITAC